MSAMARKIPVSILTEKTKVGMQEIAPGIEQYPLVKQGAALEINEPCALEPKALQNQFRDAQDRYFASWNSSLASDFIADLISLSPPSAVTPRERTPQYVFFISTSTLFTDHDVKAAFRRSGKDQFCLC
jgi:hypothetical protein